MDDYYFQPYNDDFSSENEDDNTSQLSEPIDSILSFEDYTTSS